MKEQSVYPLVLDSLNSNMTEETLFPAHVAWADSFLNKDMGASTTDWNSMKDALLEILNSQPEPLNSSAAGSSRQLADNEILLSKEIVTNLGISRISDEDEDLIDDDMGDAESMEIFEDDEEDLVLGKKNGWVRARSWLDNALQPRCAEDLVKFEDLDYSLDLNLTAFEVEPSSEEIFKVWDLGISDDLDSFSELSEAFAEVPQVQSAADDSTSWKDPKNVSVDDLVAGVGQLSLIQQK